MANGRIVKYINGLSSISASPPCVRLYPEEARFHFWIKEPVQPEGCGRGRGSPDTGTAAGTWPGGPASPPRNSTWQWSFRARQVQDRARQAQDKARRGQTGPIKGLAGPDRSKTGSDMSKTGPDMSKTARQVQDEARQVHQDLTSSHSWSRDVRWRACVRTSWRGGAALPCWRRPPYSQPWRGCRPPAAPPAAPLRPLGRSCGQGGAAGWGDSWSVLCPH